RGTSPAHAPPPRPPENARNAPGGAAVSAVRFAKQRADRAELGEPGPQLGAEAVLRLGDLVARLERILLGDEAVQGVRQHAAVFVEFEVHGQSPKIIFEMMFFWISFEPPKIDSLR